MSHDQYDTSEYGQLTLDGVPYGILRELQRIAELNGTTVSHEAAKIIGSHLAGDMGNQSHS